MKDHIFKIYLYIVWFLVNKTNFEDQMNIYNLCISFILKHITEKCWADQGPSLIPYVLSLER